MEAILSEDIIKQKFVKGVFYLSLRRVLIQVIISLVNIILARLLAPKIFGVFAIISFLVNLFGFFATFGLDKALVWKKTTFTKKQLRSIFTILLAGSLIVVLLVFFLAPLAKILYQEQLSEKDIFWLRLFGLNLFFLNMRSVSASLLEKNLDFKKITIGELTLTFLTELTIIILAIKGFGVGSFVLGNLIGSIIGVFLYFYLLPWPMGLTFSFVQIKNLLPFGFNYQAKQLIELLNLAVIPGFVGAVSGPGAVGLINWAGGVRQIGLAPADTITRLVFPACAQVQDRPELLSKLVNKIIEISCLFSLPLLALIFALAKPLTYIVYTARWLDGLTALYLGLIQAIFLLLGSILIDVLLALGQAKTVRNITFFWACLQWLLTIPLVLIWDFNGVMLAGILVSATFFIPLYQVKKKIKLNIWSYFSSYLVYSVIAGAATFLFSQKYTINSILDLILAGLLGSVVYLILIFAFCRKKLISDIMLFRKILT